METALTALDVIVFNTIAKVMGIPVESVNCQTVIPARLRSSVLVRVAINAATDVFIDENITDLTAGRILEEVKKRK